MGAQFDNNDWWQWRRSKDERDHKQDNALHSLNLEMAVLKTRQEIAAANEEARHSKTPAIAFGLVSAAVSLIVLVMQILAWRASVP